MKSKGPIDEQIRKVKRSIYKFGSTELKEDALKELLKKQGKVRSKE